MIQARQESRGCTGACEERRGWHGAGVWCWVGADGVCHLPLFGGTERGKSVELPEGMFRGPRLLLIPLGCGR